jgi:hypothetical protein
LARGAEAALQLRLALARKPVTDPKRILSKRQKLIHDKSFLRKTYQHWPRLTWVFSALHPEKTALPEHQEKDEG